MFFFSKKPRTIAQSSTACTRQLMGHHKSICPACLRPSEMFTSLCQMPQCTQILHWLENAFFLLLLLIQPSSIRNIWCFLSGVPPPLPTTFTAAAAIVSSATHIPLFLPFSLQIRAAEVYCYFIQAGTATEGPGPGWLLVNGPLL